MNTSLSSARAVRKPHSTKASPGAIVLALLSLTLGSTTASADPLFAPAISFDTGNDPRSVAVGDLNRDAKPDLVTANREGTASVLLGKGDGTFGARTDYATGIGASSVAIGDLNGDGSLDVVTANCGAYPDYVGTVSVLLGNGDGTFRPMMNMAAGYATSAIAIGDLNGDGKADLVAANEGDACDWPVYTISVFLGNGNGTFGAKTDYGTGMNPSSVAIGDLNSDGKLDLVAPNFNNKCGYGSAPRASVAPARTTANGYYYFSVSVLLGNGDGTLGQFDYNGTSSAMSSSVAIGDLNGDGRPDLAVANLFDNSVQVLFGNGDGSFARGENYAADAALSSVAIGDLNRDGKPDLVMANLGGVFTPFGNTVSVLLGNGDGTFGAKTNYGTGLRPQSVAIADLNGDGELDLAVSTGANAVSVLLSIINVPTAIEVSLASAAAAPDRVRLEWHASSPGLAATVYRRTESEAWVALGEIHDDGVGHLRFEDRAVETGRRYEYRLGILEGGSERFAAETWVDVPVGARLALEGPRPNPAAGALLVALSLPSAAPARLELLDVSGRRLQAQELRGLGPGDVLVRLERSTGVQPGVYFLRLSQGGRSLVSRASVVR